MGEFEPSMGKSFGKLIWIVMKASRNFFKGRIGSQCHISRGHDDGLADARIVRAWGICPVFGLPLMSACRTLAQHPFMTKEAIEVTVIPSCGVIGPWSFNTAGDRVIAHARAVLTEPT